MIMYIPTYVHKININIHHKNILFCYGIKPTLQKAEKCFKRIEVHNIIFELQSTRNLVP